MNRTLLRARACPASPTRERARAIREPDVYLGKMPRPVLKGRVPMWGQSHWGAALDLWIRLEAERVRQGAQVAHPVLADGRKAGPQHQHHGLKAAARELKIERTEAQRAVKDAIAEERARLGLGGDA